MAAGQAKPRAELRGADPEYFRAAGIPLLRGRAFSTADQPDSAKVVIINQTLADRLFPREDPLGKRMAWTSGSDLVFEEWHTIVGWSAISRMEDWTRSPAARCSCHRTSPSPCSPAGGW